MDALIESEEDNKELREQLKVACETIEQLRRVNKEWIATWAPINELVSHITPLGKSVSLTAAKLIKERLKQIYD